MAVASSASNDLRYRFGTVAPRRRGRRSISIQALRLFWTWFKQESPFLNALNALISIGALALAISMPPFAFGAMHWPKTSTLEAYGGAAFLALALLAGLRAWLVHRPRPVVRLLGLAKAIAFALMGLWLLAVWLFESRIPWPLKAGMAGGSLPATMDYFDASLVPLLPPALAIMVGFLFAAKQLKSVQRAMRTRSRKALVLGGLLASVCTLTIGAYAGDYRYFERWDRFGAVSSLLQDSGRLRGYEPLFAEGISCHISDGFGPRRNPFDGRLGEFHPGVDIAVAEGTPVHAMASGVIVFAGPDRGFGNMAAIRTDYGREQPVTLVAAHMERLFVATGELVQGGEVIGMAGSTGRSTGPHVHLQLCPEGHTNRRGEFVCGSPRNPYESWPALSAIARSSCARGPIV